MESETIGSNLVNNREVRMVNGMGDGNDIVLDASLFKIIKFLKNKTKEESINTNEPTFMQKIGIPFSEEADLFVYWDIKSPSEVDITKKKIIILSSTLQFYDLFELFEDKREDFKIYHLDKKLVCEVGLDGK